MNEFRCESISVLFKCRAHSERPTPIIRSKQTLGPNAIHRGLFKFIPNGTIIDFNIIGPRPHFTAEASIKYECRTFAHISPSPARTKVLFAHSDPNEHFNLFVFVVPLMIALAVGAN